MAEHGPFPSLSGSVVFETEPASRLVGGLVPDDEVWEVVSGDDEGLWIAPGEDPGADATINLTNDIVKVRFTA